MDEDNRIASKEQNELMDKLQQEIKSLEREHQEVRDDIEQKAENEINQIKIENSAEILKITESGLLSRGKLQGTMKLLADKQTEVEELRRDIKKKEEDLKNQIDSNINLRQEIKGQRNEIKERERTIDDKKTRRYELRKKTQELEKFRFVLDYKIKELKRDINPREQEIQKLKEQTTKMDQELKHFKKVNASLILIVEDLRMRQEGMQKEINKQKFSLKEDNSFINKFKEDTYECRAPYYKADFKALKSAVLKLHNKYVKEEIKPIDVDADLQKEYSNQRKYLENTVNSLQKKLIKDSDNHRKV
jgi:cilia- and flagella-associated protein 57